MFGRIIVATDLQASTRMCLRAACDLVHSDGEVLLVHVIRPVPGMSDSGQSGIYDRLRANVAVQMLELASWFKRERGVDIVCLTEIGSPGREIARTAAEREADLVVLAHDPVDDPATLGSVSYQVAHLAPCAVLVLKMPGCTKVVQPRSAKVSHRPPAANPRTRAARR